MNHRLAAAVLVATCAPAFADAPTKLFDTDEIEDGKATVTKISKEHTLADKGQARLLMVTATTTDNWGCSCPPFVYAPYSSSASDPIAFFYPIVSSGPDPAAFNAASSAGTYEFTGHFTKDKLDYGAWLDRRKEKHPVPKGDFAIKRRVFAADSWCFRLAPDGASGPYAEVIARMKKAGVAMCK